jgi:secondary thiamine-phosphate synthase enzyme
MEDSDAVNFVVAGDVWNGNREEEQPMKPNEKRDAAKSLRVLRVRTTHRTEMQDVTDEIAAAVCESGCAEGVCHLYVPHTTAGVTINEGYDPAVAQDIAAAFDRLVPRVANSAHAEGNSDSHIKTALVGSSQTVWIVAGKLALGRWQRIFFVEFDGPRSRELRVKIVADASS